MLIKNAEALEKMNEVKEPQENGKKVAVAGDGINDAPCTWVSVLFRLSAMHLC